MGKLRKKHLMPNIEAVNRANTLRRNLDDRDIIPDSPGAKLNNNFPTIPLQVKGPVAGPVKATDLTASQKPAFEIAANWGAEDISEDTDPDNDDLIADKPPPRKRKGTGG